MLAFLASWPKIGRTRTVTMMLDSPESPLLKSSPSLPHPPLLLTPLERPRCIGSPALGGGGRRSSGSGGVVRDECSASSRLGLRRGPPPSLFRGLPDRFGGDLERPDWAVGQQRKRRRQRGNAAAREWKTIRCATQTISNHLAAVSKQAGRTPEAFAR